jgi:hypothetical protein
MSLGIEMIWKTLPQIRLPLNFEVVCPPHEMPAPKGNELASFQDGFVTKHHAIKQHGSDKRFPKRLMQDKVDLAETS